MQAYRVWTGTVIECTRPWGRTRAYVQVMRTTMAVVPACVLWRFLFLGFFCLFFFFFLCKRSKKGDSGVKEEGPIWAKRPPPDPAAEIISVQ